MITLENLRKVLIVATEKRLNTFVEPINSTILEFEIVSNARISFFIAQLAHESGEFRYVRELASGSAYEGRKDLGNIEPGDGVRFKGRGLIQITGRSNYKACGADLGLPLLEHPELLEEPINASRSAGWFWNKKQLNSLADINTLESFKKVTKIINGGYNGLEDRLKYWGRAKSVDWNG
jgi:putative chitinase